LDFRIAVCKIPLKPNLIHNGWIPLTIERGRYDPHAVEETVACDFAEILVDVHVKSPLSYQCDGSNDINNIAVSPLSFPIEAMPEVFSCQRRMDGFMDDIGLSFGEDYRMVLADCYEWLWPLCFTAYDPLMVEKSTESGPEINLNVSAESPANATPPPDLHPEVVHNFISPSNVSPAQNARSLSEERKLSSFLTDFKHDAVTSSTLSLKSTANSALNNERSLSADDAQDILEISNAAASGVNTGKPSRRLSAKNIKLKLEAQDSDDEYDDVDVMGGRQSELSSALITSLIFQEDNHSNNNNHNNNISSHANRRSYSFHADTNLLTPSSVFQSEENNEIDEETEVWNHRSPKILKQPSQIQSSSSSTVLPMNLPEPPKSEINSSSPMRIASKPRSSTVKIVPRQRVDCVYDIDWIEKYIESLQDFMDEIESLLGSLKMKVKSDRSFRPSVHKKEPEWQMLPLNLHYQLIGIQRYHLKNSRRTENTESSTENVDVIHCVTCGAMSPHMLKHKNGGLYRIEKSLETSKHEINGLKNRFINQVQHYGETKISPKIRDGPYQTKAIIINKVLSFELQCIEIGRRRLFAISQSLSIACNSFLFKLAFVTEGHLDKSIAEKWVTDGFLLVFEGLLSVTGNEKSMLEDTIIAVENLKFFRIKISSFQDDVDNFPRNNIHDESDVSLEPDFQINGREIQLFLPQITIDKLPPLYQQKIEQVGFVTVALFPVLFTQVSIVDYH
jgi:hypothetical protein